MYKALIICLVTTLFSSCKLDGVRQKQFAGSYDVTLSSSKAKTELAKAKEDVQKELAKAKEDIRQGFEDAQKEVDENLGEQSKIGDAVGKFVDGMGEIAESMTDLGEELSKAGIELGESVVDGLQFQATFHENGEAFFGKNNTGKITRWQIEGDQLLLWSDGDSSKKEGFTMKKISGKEWELSGADVTFHLTRRPQ